MKPSGISRLPVRVLRPILPAFIVTTTMIFVLIETPIVFEGVAFTSRVMTQRPSVEASCLDPALAIRLPLLGPHGLSLLLLFLLLLLLLFVFFESGFGSSFAFFLVFHLQLATH